jgi:hydroxymethylpyrimidine/phosphomethylpyrimidine kinase
MGPWPKPLDDHVQMLVRGWVVWDPVLSSQNADRLLGQEASELLLDDVKRDADPPNPQETFRVY